MDPYSSPYITHYNCFHSFQTLNPIWPYRTAIMGCFHFLFHSFLHPKP